MSREMRDSKILWIGDIPQNWNILRIKNTSWLKGRIGWDGLKSEEFQETGPYLITGTDFKNGYIDWDTCVHITEERFAEDELLHIHEGDLLITKDGTIGKLAIAKNCPDKVSLNSGVMIIRNNSKWKYNEKYMYYVLNSSVFSQWFESEQKPGSTIKHLYQHQFEEFQFPLPSLNEQFSIVSYLDSKCSAIDEAIERHKKIIEKLEEYRTEVISNEILGLRHNDVIETGIDWMSKMSASRKAWRLKYLVKESLKYGANESGVPYDETLPRYIRITDIATDGGLKDTGKLSLSEEQASKYILEDGTILFARSGATVGKTFLYRDTYGRSAFAGYLISAVPNTEMLVPGWLKYFTESIPYKNWIDRIFTQATIQNIGADKYSELVVPICSIEEQTAVVSKLDEIATQITKMIESQRSIIEKLEEYRKSLIYNAVTGKIDCRTEDAG